MPGVRGRLSAARVALSISERGSAVHAASSSAQATSLRDYLSRAMPTLTSDDKAALVPAISEVGFLETDLARILNDLVQPGQTATVRARRPQQDYLAFANYLTEQHWSKVLDPDRNATSKQEVIFGLVASLGLRFPSQPTKKRFCSFNLLLTHDWDQCMGMSMQTKKLSATTIGDSFTVFARAAGPPSSFIEKLPADPHEMRQRYPSMFAAIYSPGQEPVLPKIDLLRVQMLDDSFRCRGVGVAPASSTALAPAIPTISTGPTMQGMEHFATMIATCMHSLGEQQTRMMELMMGGRGVGVQPGNALGTHTSITPPRGLQRLLQGNSPLAPQGRLANLTLSGSRSLSHPIGSEIADAASGLQQSALTYTPPPLPPNFERRDAVVEGNDGIASLIAKYGGEFPARKEETGASPVEGQALVEVPATPKANPPLAAPPVKDIAAGSVGGGDQVVVALGGPDPAKEASERAAKMLEILGDRDEERKKKRQEMAAVARAAKKPKTGAEPVAALTDAAAPKMNTRLRKKTAAHTVPEKAAKRGVGRPRKA